MKTIPLWVCFVLFFMLSFCMAADFDYKAEVFGEIGVSQIHDDESSLGTGFDFGGGIGFRPKSRIGVEFEIDYLSFSRDFPSGVRFEGNTTNFGGNLQFYFAHGSVEPYVFAGAGITHFDQTNTFPDSEIFESTQDSFAFPFGGGIRFFMSPRLSLRPEFRWSWNGISFMNQIRGSVSVGYHW